MRRLWKDNFKCHLNLTNGFEKDWVLTFKALAMNCQWKGLVSFRNVDGLFQFIHESSLKGKGGFRCHASIENKK